MKPVSFKGVVYLLTDPAYRTALLDVVSGLPIYNLEDQYQARFVAKPLADLGALKPAEARALLNPDTVAALDMEAKPAPAAERLYAAPRTSDRLPFAFKPAGKAAIASAMVDLTHAGYTVIEFRSRFRVKDPDGVPVLARDSTGASSPTLDSHALIALNAKRKG